MYHLSKQDLDDPWIVIDFKYDSHINSIDRAEEVDLGFVPKKNHRGIFIMHPRPTDQDKELLEKNLWDLWEREDVGIFVDEGFMLGRNNEAYNAIQTQGRSKHIPTITLTQRPVWLSPFILSEADFYQVFHLNKKSDKKTVSDFIPYDFDTRLPEYHSVYYDVSRDNLVLFSPVPKVDQIIEDINHKLEPKRRWL